MVMKKQAVSTSNGSPTGKKCKFISVHIPKTGGTVFLRQILNKKFLEVHVDYRKNHFLEKEPKTIECNIIHGHFPASRYLERKLPYITWLRDPLERIVSHYNWILKVTKRELEFDEFIEKHANRMNQYMDIDREKFVFVGILERWNDSIKLFSRITDTDLEKYLTTEFKESVRKTYKKGEGETIFPNEKQLRRILELNEADYDLYFRECERLKKEVRNETIDNHPLCE